MVKMKIWGRGPTAALTPAQGRGLFGECTGEKVAGRIGKQVLGRARLLNFLFPAFPAICYFQAKLAPPFLVVLLALPTSRPLLGRFPLLGLHPLPAPSTPPHIYPFKAPTPPPPGSTPLFSRGKVVLSPGYPHALCCFLSSACTM